MAVIHAQRMVALKSANPARLSKPLAPTRRQPILSMLSRFSPHTHWTVMPSRCASPSPQASAKTSGWLGGLAGSNCSTSRRLENPVNSSLIYLAPEISWEAESHIDPALCPSLLEKMGRDQMPDTMVRPRPHPHLVDLDFAT